ncbi:hypothetical protein L3Q82_019706, partial [Scortum barcoo]
GLLTSPVWPQVVADSQSSDSGTILRVRGPLEFKCQLDSTDAHKVISRTFEALYSQLKSESCVLTVCDSPVIIWPNKGVYASPEEITPNTLCEDLHQWIQTDEQESVGKRSAKKKSKKSSAASVINLRLMMEVTKTGPLSAPVLSRTVQKSHFVSTTLPMDCVVRTTCDDKIKDAIERLLEALTHQLHEMEKVTLQHTKGTTLLVPEPLHFLLPEPKGLVTVVYPVGVPDSQLETQRKELHQEFELPDDWPYFRRANSYHFPNEPYKDGYLRNPHLALTHPAMDNGKLYLVQGIYSYHHYMQDHMDDNGWGCAYRSLQTICSWFQQQGYVERPVPTHKEIQQALVDVGDKQGSFVGSRQWIGSIEVQAVLNQLLGVTSKIMFVSQGSELASKGRELANHFLTEGTPIMIGGGVLAHTILGVAWSETTGQIRYLILDPHYTGAEDLQVITDKTAMFNPSELEGEVDHSFFDSDCDDSRDGRKRMEKGLKAGKEGLPAQGRLQGKQTQNARGACSQRTDGTTKHLKPVKSSGSSKAGRKENSSQSKEEYRSRASSTSSSCTSGADDKDVYNRNPNETEKEALPSNAKHPKERNKQSPKKRIRNRHTRSPSPTSTEASLETDSEISSSRINFKCPVISRHSKSSSSGVRRTQVGSAGSRGAPAGRTEKSDDTMTDVSLLSSPDCSLLQSLDLNPTETEEGSLKEQQQKESVPSSGLSNTHRDEDSDPDVGSLRSESQLRGKMAFGGPRGRNRKNYSFTNDEVRCIDRENQRLLRELSRLSPGLRSGSTAGKKTHMASNLPCMRLAHSALNRQREQQRIERENLAFLKRLESVKPTPGLKRSQQLADYQRFTGYLGGPSYPNSGPRPVSSRAVSTTTDSANTPVPRSKKPSAARPAWC